MKQAAGQRLDFEVLRQTADVLRVLAHPQRLRIVEILQCEGEAPVHAILREIGLPQATVSQHLNHMRRSGLIAAARRGREVWYRIADPSSLTILDCIRKKARGGIA